jgi:hypothetical protein
MSASVSVSVERLSPRALRVRNRCLAVLAARRSLPIPGEQDFASMGDVTLEDAWSRWEKTHELAAPLPRGFELPARPRSRWRTPFAYKATGLVVAGLLGFVIGKQFLPAADAQSSAGVVAQPWLAVTDSIVNAVNQTLYRARDARGPLSLSAADAAALIFRSARRHTVYIDSITARADSMLGIRGHLAGAAVFELRGALRIVRRGTAELQVTSLLVDSVDVAPTMITRLVARGRARSESSDRLRFDVPLDVAAIAVNNGVIELTRLRPSFGPSAVRQ